MDGLRPVMGPDTGLGLHGPPWRSGGLLTRATSASSGATLFVGISLVHQRRV